jgi:selenocysteine-specific elongation factor
MPVVGTAGHVDHGKSTLIQAITGRDPDRWAEERRRGLTIDLGFAWTTLPGGVEVSFVDVPGHEKFLKNMLAGIEVIDVALLVVAADEGWKPQSEEHLAALDLLEVTSGMVALTKTDLVDDDLAALAAAEIEEHLIGSTLEGAPVIHVSGLTGDGVPHVLETLATLLPDHDGDVGRPRLWVDRSFAVPGAGTVVTGTLVGGSLSVDDTVEILPEGRQARIRGIQSHEKDLESVAPGRRVALNLGGVDHNQVVRGDMIGLPGQWGLTRRFAARLETARHAPAIEPRGAFQIHVGSASQRMEIVGMDDGRAVIRVARPIPLAVGDRYIVRDTGRQMVVGGGRVLDPGPGRTKDALVTTAQIDPGAGPDDIAQWLLGMRGHDTLDRLAAHSGGGRPADAATVGNLSVDPGNLADLTIAATGLVSVYHSDHPLRPGMPLATLAKRLGVETPVVELIVDKSGPLVRDGPDVSLASHAISLDEAESHSWEKAVEMLQAGLAVPDESELGLDPELLHLKVRTGELVRIAPGLVYLPDQVAELRRLIAAAGDEFTVAEFRDVAGLSRKYAVPILEWADKEGLTVRHGDIRSLR